MLRGYTSCATAQPLGRTLATVFCDPFRDGQTFRAPNTSDEEYGVRKVMKICGTSAGGKSLHTCSEIPG